jgi:hypothetical protein
MIMGCDFHTAGSPIKNWLIYASVAKRQLIGFESKRSSKKLIAKADTKKWDPPVQYFLKKLYLFCRRTWVTWSIREEHSVGLSGKHCFNRCQGWQNCDHQSPVDHVFDGRAFNAQIEN